MIPTKRGFSIDFVENQPKEAVISKGYLLSGLMLDMKYTATVTTIATAVRSLPAPFKTISIIGDGNKVLHSITRHDAINRARIWEQMATAAIVTPPSGVAVAAYPNCLASVPIFFAEPFATEGLRTMLASWAFDEVKLRVEWGSHAELYVGGVGSVAIAAGGATFTQLEGAAVPGTKARALEVARGLGLHVDRYKQVAAPAAITKEFALSLPVPGGDWRAIMITTEDVNGEPTNGIIDKITMLENQSQRIYSGVPGTALRADNARLYGVTMPTGVYILEFAEDRDITDIYEGGMKDTVDLLIDTTAVVGTIRAHLVTIEKPYVA